MGSSTLGGVFFHIGSAGHVREKRQLLLVDTDGIHMGNYLKRLFFFINFYKNIVNFFKKKFKEKAKK